MSEKYRKSGSVGGVPSVIASEIGRGGEIEMVKNHDGSTIQTNQLDMNAKKLMDDNNLLQISIPPYQQVQYGKRRRETLLPSNVTIPVGLAQVFIGSSMVICGSLAFRYRSYLFYYGTGLWAGTIAGLTGALAIMCTKKGLPKLRSMCGGRKWQLQVFVASTMLALVSAVLVSIFSTSGLMQDTQYTVDGREIENSIDDDVFEKRKSTGVAINAILLLLAMLEILLAFCSFGIVLSVVCRSRDPSSSLVSSDSMISQMTVRDILGVGTGPEYEARKDRLFRWLTHQGRNLFINSSSQSSSPRHKNGTAVMLPNHGHHGDCGNNFMVPHLVAIQPPSSGVQNNTLIPNGQSSRRILYHRPQQMLIPHIDSPAYYPMPILMQPPPTNLIPICPLVPMGMGRRPKTPIYASTYEACNGNGGGGARRIGGNGNGSGRRRKIGSLHGSMNGSFKSSNSKRRNKINNTSSSSCKSTSSRSNNNNNKNKSSRKIDQMTEDEIGKTYTGLDQTIAEDFIRESMDKY